MQHIMPQEIEVWYLIPALRREMVKVLIRNHGMSQKDASKVLGITESAVSQYLSDKRGNEMTFSKKDNKKIEECVKDIIKDKENVMDHMYKLCLEFRESGTICEIHRKHDSNVGKRCNVCLEN